MNKKYIILVSFGTDLPVVVSSELSLDGEYNVYCELSYNIAEAIIKDDDNFFKAVLKSFAYNKDYKVRKFYLQCKK